jgi:ribosomal protein L37AE/L43A
MAEPPKCPNCRKKMLWNYQKGRWECAKNRLAKGGILERYGCGYALITEEQRTLK